MRERFAGLDAKRTIITGAVVLAAIVGGTVAYQQIPSAQDTVQRPFFYTGHAPGVGTFEVQTVQRDPSVGVPSEGQWVAVRGTFTADSTPLAPNSLLIDAKGREISPSNLSDCPVSQPEIPRDCELVFEVDPAAADSLTLQLYRQNRNGAAVLEVPLEQ